MTVSELQELLRQMPPDALVVIPHENDMTQRTRLRYVELEQVKTFPNGAILCGAEGGDPVEVVSLEGW